MPKCKYCHENITKFDKERCPRCGCLNPLEDNYQETCDITSVINTVDSNISENAQFKQHSKKINAFLMIFFGVFSIDAFYLGFIKNGLIRLLINIIFMGGLFCLFYFLPVFKTNGLLLSALSSFGIAFVIYVVFGIITLSQTGKKDSNGVFLK